MKPERIEHPEYRLQVPDGEDRGEGYVAISHGQTYALILHNFSSRNCDVRVEIDGQHVGTWRVPKSDSQRIERPAHDTGRFTFLAAGTSEARSAGIQEGNDKNGLISATFMPEKIQRSGYLSAARLSDAKEGATGLSGESKQRFTNTDALDTDESAYFTIHLRLVAKNPVVRPLMGSSTPIPPPLPP